MALNRYKLGDLVDTINQKCNIHNLTIYEVSGINKEKEFFSPTVQVGQDTSNYKKVPPHHFSCNLMHVGRDIAIPIALNRSDRNIIVSPAYSVFYVQREDLVLEEYLYMIFKKIDFDRYAAFCTDSSVRDGLEWNRFLEIEIDLPSIEEQKKVVDVYLAMVANQKTYEYGLEDLKLTCDAYIEHLRTVYVLQPIKPFIELKNEKNNQGFVKEIKGISKDGFIHARRGMDEYRPLIMNIARQYNFVYNPSKLIVGSIGIWKSENPIIVSPIYTVFEVINYNLLPEYLFLWFKREEFKRYSAFYSGGIYEQFGWNQMEEYEIPIPPVNIQKSIVEVYEVYESRKQINEQLKQQINEICPILIKGSITAS